METLAFLSAITTGVLWGITPTLYSEAVRSKGPVCANAWKSWGALAVSWVVTTFLGLFEVPSLRAFSYITLNAFLGAVIGDYAFFRGIKIAGAGKATPVGFTYILWATLLSNLSLGEPISLGVISGAFLSVFGIWLLYEDGKWDLSGIVWSLIASLFWAISPMIMKLALEEVNPFAASAWGSVVMAVVFSFMASRADFSGGYGLRKAALGGGLGIGIGLTLFYYSVSRLGVSIPVLATAVSPLVTQLASWIGGEAPTPRTLLGSGIIALGIALGAS